MTNSLSAVLPTVFDTLFNFSQSDGFWDNIAIAFGTDYDVTKITEIRTQWQNRAFSQLPKIEVINDDILGNIRGSYAVNSNQIYLADSFVETASSELIVTVLLEEIGHFVDTKINEIDTVGDEGELFSGLVREYDFTETELTRIKGENDLNYLFWNNDLVALETSEPIILIVNTTVDENDGSAILGTGLSLRDAINIANKSPNTPYIIKLGSGITYELTYDSYFMAGDHRLITAGNITIEADGNDYATIINNSEIIPGVLFSYIIDNQPNSTLILNNITITNKEDSGIYNQGLLTVDNSFISENTGLGIVNNIGADLTVTNTTISDNSYGGIDNYGSVTLTDNIISNNIIGITNYRSATLENNTISNNTINGIMNSGSATLTNNTITNNTINGIMNSGNVTLDNNRITDNDRDGIRNSGTAKLTNNAITGNGRDGIINSGTAELTNNTITDNKSGGAANSFGTLTLVNNTVSNNYGYGGIVNSFGTLTLNHNMINDNTGGGIYNSQNSTAYLTNNIITRNTSDDDGGGIYNDQNSKIYLTNNTITSNTSEGKGGGIYNDQNSKIYLTNNTITSNTSEGKGGGIYNAGTWSSNSTISGNTSNQEWYITSDGELTTDPYYINVENELHPTYPDIYDISDPGTFTPLPPSPETLPKPTLSISNSWVEVDEDIIKKSLIFEVELSSEYDQPITVEYYTLDGNATSVNTLTSTQDLDFNSVSKNILSFFPGETKKQIEIAVFNSSPVTDDILELFARDTAYRKWTDADKGKLVDSIANYDALWSLGYEDYYIDEIINNNETGFSAVGLTAHEDLFVVLTNPINAKIAENNNNLLEEISDSSGGTDTQAYIYGQNLIEQLDNTEQDYTFAKGTIYDRAKPPILAIRGTEPTSPADILSDLNPKGVGYNQFIGSQTDINQWLSNVSNPEENLNFAPHITGHSLGGALTQWVGGSYPGELGKIVTFNSPGISQQQGINLNPSNNQGVKHYIMSADIVSMAGSTYLSGVWDLYQYSKLESAITFEKHLVPILNPEILGTEPKKPTDLVTKIFNGDTTELSHFYFTYLPDADYFALQVAVAEVLESLGGFIGGLAGRYIARALTFRGTVERHREDIGPVIGTAIDLILSSYDTISDTINSASDTINSAWNAAKSWTSNAWDSIIEEAKETLGLVSTSISNFWDAIPLWTEEAWDATTKWSDAAWESITEWTSEIWEMTTQWTQSDWNIPFLTITNPTATENNSNNQELVFKVSLSTPSSETITVNYATEDDTAIAGNDYTSINGILTFEPGEIEKTITIPILSDNVLEEEEKLYLNLSQSTNAHLTDHQAIATIVNQEMSNQSPTDLNLSNSRIREHQPTETIIGEFITTDPDTGDTFTYTLVSGTDSTDNNLFTIDNNQLKTNTTFDYETKNTYNIRVRTTDQDGLFFEKALTINIDNVNEASFPIIKNSINDILVFENTTNNDIDLLSHFDDPLSTGKIATFQLYNTDLAGGIINVLLFDQAENGAPLTVNNFINYINDNDYDNSIIHRSMTNFVIQGGGFIVNSLSVDDVPTDFPVENEFSANRSNLRGTIAMAKLGSSPDSATSQWFFNLKDNASNLDNQNGGFTVFGEVLTQNDLAVIDKIAEVPVFDLSNTNSAFANFPLQIDPDNPVINDDNDLVRFRDITVADVDELTFSVVNNSNPNLVDAKINNNQLILDYLDNQTGTAEITIRGTSLLGHTVEDTFSIKVNPKTDINLTNNTIEETAEVGTIIGEFNPDDPNEEGNLTYELVDNTDATDNSLFTLENNQLKTSSIFNYETQQNYTTLIRITDQDGLSYEKSFTINISDVDEQQNNNIMTNLVGAYNTSGSAIDVEVRGNHAYVADGSSGLQIINISNPSRPILRGTYKTSASAESLDVVGNYAYLANSTSGLTIVDISNPFRPKLVGSYNTPDRSFGVKVVGNYAYVTDFGEGLYIINISNPSNPTLQGHYDTSGRASDVEVIGQYAYVADGLSGLQIIDISNPSNPTLEGTYNTPSNAFDIKVVGNYAYIADGFSGLQIIDISNPSNPTFEGSYNTPGVAWDLQVVGNSAYVADDGSGLQVIDISDPSNPTLTRNINTISAIQEATLGVDIANNYLYLANHIRGLKIVDLNQPPSNLTLTLNQNNYHPLDTLTLMGNVIDDNGSDDLDNVDIRLKRGGGRWKKLTNLETFEDNGDFSYQLDLDNYKTGNYQIRARVKDEQGTFTPWEKESFTIENETPSNLTFTLNQNSYHPSQSLTLMGNVIDEDGNEDLDNVDIRLKRGGGRWKKLTNLETFEDNGDFSYQLDLDNYKTGNYQIRARVKDEQGTFTPWEKESFTIENKAPKNLTFTLDQNSYDPSQSLTLMGNVIDEDGNEDLDNVDIRLKRGRGRWKKLTNLETFEENGDFSYQLELDNYKTGNYQIRVRVQDKQGAYTPWVEESFTIENQLVEPDSISAMEQLLLTANTETNQVDILTGTSQPDLFELGDEGQIYYSTSGTEDYALINNFDVAEDIIQLHGESDNYSLGMTSQELPQGTTISRNNDELIAIVTGESQLSLSENYFSFV